MTLLSRAAAVDVARGWIGTPYVTGARVRGAGCDCATFVAGYLEGIGAAEHIELSTYAQDWFCHAREERYFNELSKYARCTWEGICFGRLPAQPGDILAFRVANSRIYNHGAVVTSWPEALHAFGDHGVAASRPTLHPLTAHREVAIFSPWALGEKLT